MLSGKGYIEYNGNTYTVSSGDFYFFNNTTQLKYYADSDVPFKKMFINVGGNIIYDITNTFQLGALMIRHIDVLDNFRELHSILEQLDIKHDPALVRTLSKMMYELIDTVADHDVIYGSVLNTSNACMIHDYIDNHLTREISLSDIAKKFFMSEEHCIRIFRQEYGITPIKYLIDSRIRKSCELVISTDLPIRDIAQIFQYCDLQHYSKAFKQYYGVTPLQYRKLNNEREKAAANK